MMAKPRTAWHVLFYALLEERKPKHFEIQAEVPLSKEPQRADYLILRRKRAGKSSDAQTLRKLWPAIKKDALVELKTASFPLKKGDLIKLLGYGYQYAATQRSRFKDHSDFLLVLITPSLTWTLKKELSFFGIDQISVSDGYATLRESCLGFPLLIAFLDDVSKKEKDEILGLFSRNKPTTKKALHWFFVHTWSGEKIMELEELEGYDEMVSKFLNKLPVKLRLKGLDPKQRLEGLDSKQILEEFDPKERLDGLDPEQRLEGLDPEQILESLPDDVKQALIEKLKQ